MPIDAVEAAKEQGWQERINTEQQTAANRPDQYNPWGATTWGTEKYWDPALEQYLTRYTQQEQLAEPLQNTLDNQMMMGELRSDIAAGATARALRDYQDPMNWDQYGDPIRAQAVEGAGRFDFDPNANRQSAEDAAYGRATSRLDPQYQQMESRMMTDLRNKGLSPGDQAYDAAMGNFNRGRTDAYEQARLGSTLEGRSEADQMYNQALAGYQTNLGAQGQEFGQAQQSAAMANALRQQDMQEGVAQRQFNLAEADYIMGDAAVQGGPPGTGGQTTTQQQPMQNQAYP